MLKREDQESVRTLHLRDPQAAEVGVSVFARVCICVSLWTRPSPGCHGYLQRLKATILEARLARQQHRMARQKSQRFLKMSTN